MIIIDNLLPINTINVKLWLKINNSPNNNYEQLCVLKNNTF